MTISPVELYCGLMEEIKLRVGFIEYACNNPGPVPQFIVETCFLQLRMIHELVAIGCIAIQSKHVNIGRLEKEWSANEIMPHLERLNPAFFPRAIAISGPAQAGYAGHVVEPTQQEFTKAVFLKNYGRCGGQLHRGTLRKIASSMPPKPASFDEVREITSGLKKLLNTHSIHAPDNTRYWCIMHDKQNENRVTVLTGAFFPDPQ